MTDSSPSPRHGTPHSSPSPLHGTPHSSPRRETSEKAAAQFEDDFFDWVYVDGNHLYEFVKRDLEVYLPKVKRGGLVICDDYMEGIGEWWAGGVKRAVDEFVAKGQLVWATEAMTTQAVLMKAA